MVSQDVQSGIYTQPLTQTTQETPVAESTGIDDEERPNILQDVSVLSSVRNTANNQTVQDPVSPQRNQLNQLEDPIRDSQAPTIINEGIVFDLFRFIELCLKFSSSFY